MLSTLQMRTMKIKETRQAYTAQLEVLRNRQRKLLKAREENDAQFKYSSQEEVWNGGSGGSARIVGGIS